MATMQFMLLTVFKEINITSLHKKELGTKVWASVLEQVTLVIPMLDRGTVRKREVTLLLGISFSSSGITCLLPVCAVLEDKLVAKQSLSWTGRRKLLALLEVGISQFKLHVHSKERISRWTNPAVTYPVLHLLKIWRSLRMFVFPVWHVLSR